MLAPTGSNECIKMMEWIVKSTKTQKCERNWKFKGKICIIIINGFCIAHAHITHCAIPHAGYVDFDYIMFSIHINSAYAHSCRCNIRSTKPTKKFSTESNCGFLHRNLYSARLAMKSKFQITTFTRSKLIRTCRAHENYWVPIRRVQCTAFFYYFWSCCNM